MVAIVVVIGVYGCVRRSVVFEKVDPRILGAVREVYNSQNSSW